MSEWREYSLTEAGRIVTGKTPPTANKEFYDGDIPFLTPSDMDGRRTVTRTARCLTSLGADKVKSSYILEPAIAVSCIGSDMGKAVLVDAPFVSNQQINSLVINECFDRLFVYYNLSGRKAEILDKASGAAQPIMNKTEFGRLKILAPEKNTQESISSVLGALDDKIELNRRMNETLEGMARALFKDWFVDFGPTRAKMEGRPPYLTPDLWNLFPDNLNPDTGLPEGWEEKAVSDFSSIKGGKQLTKNQFIESGQVPVFGGAGIMGHTDQHNADGFVISVGRVGAYCGQFFSYRGKAWINNNASLIMPHDVALGEWLFFALLHLDIDLIKKGAAQPFVSNSDIGAMLLTYPGEPILKEFIQVLAPLLRRSEANEEESRTLVQTRDLLLPRLMSGEIRLKDAEKEVEAAV